MFRTLRYVLFAAMVPALALAQSTVEVSDSDIQPGQDVRWTAGNTYVLDGLVFVDEGATLTIEPGTVIKGKPGQGESASALVVARGGRVLAEGTADNPIIFTAEADDVDDPDDLPIDARGLWGGVIILGRATLNSTPGESSIEGISVTEARGVYGDSDNSGVFRYVSIRHGGTDIGAGNEINGLTMGGVGSGTLIEFVEVFNNQDDGFEWFGGTVNTRYLVSAFNGDDAFDYDEGFRGKGQFWFVLQAADAGNRAGEHDGGTDPEDGQPYAIPTIYNATYIGSGTDSDNGSNDVVLKIRDNAGGRYVNSIFFDFAGEGLDVEDLESGEDSRARMEAGDLVLANNIWYGFAAGNTLEAIAPQDFVRAHLSANDNRAVDPQLQGVSRSRDMGLDPRPGAGSPALSGAAAPPDDGFFEQTSYLGAFGPGDRWADDWTLLSDLGILARGEETVVKAETALSGAVPTSYSLEQNYPNPFNPSTTITYSLPRDGWVELAIFDALGRRAAALVDGERRAGIYAVTMEASDISSGVYFYRLKSKTAAITRRMTLLK